jgi:hypothetical protein
MKSLRAKYFALAFGLAATPALSQTTSPSMPAPAAKHVPTKFMAVGDDAKCDGTGKLISGEWDVTPLPPSVLPPFHVKFANGTVDLDVNPKYALGKSDEWISDTLIRVQDLAKYMLNHVCERQREHPLQPSAFVVYGRRLGKVWGL